VDNTGACFTVSSVKAGDDGGAGGDGGDGGAGGDGGDGGDGGTGGLVGHHVAGLPQTERDADLSLFTHLESQSATGRFCGHQQQ